jgi:hypothetical protein
VETGYTLQVKHVRIKAYIGYESVPITNGSITMTPAGYRFSIGIPPSKSSVVMKYGSYGRIYYSDSMDESNNEIWNLLCDGYLLNDSLTANKGVFIRQLVFADCNDASRFIYIDDNILSAPTPVSKGGELQETMFSRLKSEGGVDIIGRSELTGTGAFDFGNKLSNLLNQKAESTKWIGLKQKAGNDATQMITQKNSELYSAGETVFQSPGSFFMYLYSIMTKSKISSRYLLSDRWLRGLSSTANYGYCPGALLHVTTGVLDLALKWMYSSAGVSDFSSMTDEALSVFMMQKIIVPGRIGGQVVILPATPFLPVVPYFNELSDKYESVSISFGGDIPCSTSVFAANELSGDNDGKIKTENPIFGFAGGVNSIFYTNTYIHKMYHEYYNLFSRVFNWTTDPVPENLAEPENGNRH